jgi:HAD superfamily hydrolase (TIGR01509 family)
MIRGLLFDFDGLILDTESPDYQSWQEVFAAHGAELSREIWAQYICSSDVDFDPYTHLEAQIGHVVDRAAIRAQRRARDLALIAAQPIMPGVVDYLDDAKRMNLQIGIASNSPRAWVAGHLERLGLIHHFEQLTTIEAVTKGKPEPDIYLAAVDALGLQPHEAIALEDSPNGSLAAKRAGLFCVAVPNPMTRHFDWSHVDVRLESLAAMRLEEVIEQVWQNGNERKQKVGE